MLRPARGPLAVAFAAKHTRSMIHFTWSGGAALGSLLDIQGGTSRAVIHRWRSDRFRLLIYTYDAHLCGPAVPVDEPTESRKARKVTFYATPSSFASQASTTSTACMTGSTRRTQRSPCSPPRRRPSTRTATSKYCTFAITNGSGTPRILRVGVFKVWFRQLISTYNAPTWGCVVRAGEQKQNRVDGRWWLIERNLKGTT